MAVGYDQHLTLWLTSKGSSGSFHHGCLADSASLCSQLKLRNI